MMKDTTGESIDYECDHRWAESTDPACWYCVKCGKDMNKKTGEIIETIQGI